MSLRRTYYGESQPGRRFRHSVIVGDQRFELRRNELGGREMNCIQRTKYPWIKGGSGVEQRIVEPDQMNISQQQLRPPERRVAEVPYGARHFRAGESTRDALRPCPEKTSQSARLPLTHDKFH